VLCLGVAVGHIQMSDDQVVANVMLSMPAYVCLYSFLFTHHIRHQLPRLAAQETLAKCQVIAHKVDDGQTYPPVLNVYYSSTFTTRRGHEFWDQVNGERGMVGHNAQHEAPHAWTNGFWGLGADWELMWSAG
jgi:hypothetical protein